MKTETMQITTTKGVMFNVVFCHDRNNKNRPVVQFYDSRQIGKSERWQQYGQLASSYCLETMAAHPKELGLRLDGGVPAWDVDSGSLRIVISRAEGLLYQFIGEAMAMAVTLKAIGNDADEWLEGDMDISAADLLKAIQSAVDEHSDILDDID